MLGRPSKIEFCATAGRIQESLVLGVLVGGGETVQGPGLTACPARVVAPSLVSRLSEKLACLEVKQTLVRSAAVAPDQEPPGGQTMFGGDLPERLILGLLGSVKNDSDVHHDVDEKALRRHKRAQIFAFRLKA